MSNLPPGVTGNEWQIAGPDFERDEERECDRPGISVRTITQYGEDQINAAIEELRSVSNQDITRSNVGETSRRSATAAVSRLREALSDIMLAETETHCPFVGMVTVQGYNGVITWECPLCRYMHEEEMGDE